MREYKFTYMRTYKNWLISKPQKKFVKIHCFKKIRSLILIEITQILADTCGVKSPSSSRIFILGIWGLREILTRFNPFLTLKYIIIRKAFSPNSIIYLTHRPIFSEKVNYRQYSSRIRYLVAWNSFGSIWTILIGALFVYWNPK